MKKVGKSGGKWGKISIFVTDFFIKMYVCVF